jgi:hypothetical protein
VSEVLPSDVGIPPKDMGICGKNVGHMGEVPEKTWRFEWDGHRNIWEHVIIIIHQHSINMYRDFMGISWNHQHVASKSPN